MEGQAEAGGRTLYHLRSEETGRSLTAISPPDTVEWLAGLPPALERRALSPFGVWQLRHDLIHLTTSWGALAALHAGRVQLEPYQLVPVRQILASPHHSLLIADDVGLGKTVEAGLCLVELMARGVAQPARPLCGLAHRGAWNSIGVRGSLSLVHEPGARAGTGRARMPTGLLALVSPAIT